MQNPTTSNANSDSSVIHVLAAEVVDQIAAGEVVERPAHMVKELVENALDAGATRIEVDFCDGGRWVQVRDNGKGISPVDLPKALQRFATSKISASEDLWKLNSFGFRGEALASISSVSRFTMVSKRQQDEFATRMITEFGKILEVEKISGQVGTQVTVENLFANVPARLKFLKSDAAEATQIKAMMKAMALSNYQVEFRLEENGKLIWLATLSDSRKERVEQILEIKPMYEGTAERGNVKAHAVFADPHQVGKTSKNIWLFAQNRWIQDRSLQAAVMEAYRNLLMHGEYPIAVIWVETEASSIDVNIHPTKSAVKFQEASLAFRAVAASLRESLEKAPWLANRISNASPSPKSFTQPSFHQKQFEDVQLSRTQYNQKSFDLEFAAQQQVERQAAHSSLVSVVPTSSISLASPNPSFEAKFAGPGEFQREAQHEANNVANSEAIANENPAINSVARKYWSSLHVIGQLNLTYILCQTEKGMVLVDQHAAHERVAFEQLMEAWSGGRIDVQEYLFPLAIDLSAEKVEALQTQVSDFARLGVHLEVLGPSTIGVKAAPAFVKESVFAKILEKLASDIVENGGSFELQKAIGDICATMACHSVVRAGQALSVEQMRQLLQEMDHYPLSSFCPHGRPVSVEYPFYKIEKEFGRLV